MTTAGSFLLSFAVPCLFLLSFESSLAADGRKAIVQGASHANLRSGPNRELPSIAILKEGDEVIVEGEAGAWYRVALTYGRKGYLHKSLVKLIEDHQVQVALTEQIAVESQTPVKPSEASKPSKLPTSQPVGGTEELKTKPTNSTTTAENPRSFWQFLEGREDELWLCLATGLVFFIIGWIFGGSYYVRRERARRTKLRF